MESIAPDDEHHSRVEWPYHLDQVSTSLPAALIALLACNTPPSAGDVELVEQFRAPILEKISEYRSKEEEIQSKIRELERELTAVKCSRWPLEKQVHACNVITSPFRRLPQDIIHEIIQHCPVYDHAHQDTHFPLTLSQVCRSWRRLVQGTSSLWREFKVIWPRKSDPVPLFKHCARLSESRSLPLILTLEDRTRKSSRAALTGLETFLQQLMLDLTITRRLEVLEILAPQRPELLRIWNDKEFPLLRSFLLLPYGHMDLHSEGEELGNNELPIVIHKLLRNAPLLVKMCCSGESINQYMLKRYSKDELRGWSQLTTLNFASEPMHIEDWHIVIRRCTNLERVCAIIEGNANYSSTPTYTHRHLQELVLHYAYYQHHILFPFAGLCLPKLNALQVVCNQADNGFKSRWGDYECSDMFPSLESLIIGNIAGVECGFKDLIPLLEAASTAKSLLISLSDENALEFLDIMQTPLEGGCLPLPNLRELELEFLPVLPNAWPHDEERRLTAALVKTRRLRSLTPTPPLFTHLNPATAAPGPVSVLDKMKVCYSARSAEGVEVDSEDLTAYFRGLRHGLSTFDDFDVDIDVEIHLPSEPGDRDSKAFMSPLMRRFMTHFEYWKPLRR